MFNVLVTYFLAHSKITGKIETVLYLKLSQETANFGRQEMFQDIPFFPLKAIKTFLEKQTQKLHIIILKMKIDIKVLSYNVSSKPSNFDCTKWFLPKNCLHSCCSF